MAPSAFFQRWSREGGGEVNIFVRFARQFTETQIFFGRVEFCSPPPPGKILYPPLFALQVAQIYS